jgi:AhpD family alkylhydroperoxidase
MSVPRMDITELAGGPYAAMYGVEKRIELDLDLKELVRLRASMINSCAYCVDMHWTDARERGESEARLAQVAVWQESPLFNDRERAALALTDAVTRVADTHVPDDVWAEAERHFEPDVLAHLLVMIAAINFWNRLGVATRMAPDTAA